VLLTRVVVVGLVLGEVVWILLTGDSTGLEAGEVDGCGGSNA